jgi:hypothetical protein
LVLEKTFLIARFCHIGARDFASFLLFRVLISNIGAAFFVTQRAHDADVCRVLAALGLAVIRRRPSSDWKALIN